MTFQPVIAGTGYAGWRFLAQTLPAQQQAFRESPVVANAATYFRDNIGAVRTVDDLMADRRLLSVALGAFGLDDDIGNTAFIAKVLSEGTLSEDAFANRLSDKRYAAMSREFGFGDLGARTGLFFFAEEIVARFESRQFERAVGNQNGDMRLALNLSTALAEVTAEIPNPATQWFGVMGSPPLRNVFEKALGFSSSFGRIDIDQQRQAFQNRAMATFGTDKVADFADPTLQERLIRLFLIRSEAATNATTSAGATALALLRAAR